MISLQSMGLSSIFSNTTVRKHQFFGFQPSLWPNCHIVHDYCKNHSFDHTDFFFGKVMSLLFNTIRYFTLNKNAGASHLLSKAPVGVIAFWGHKMGLKTLQSCYSRCLNSLAKITAGTADITPGIWNERYKIGKAEKALVNIIKNSLQAIRLQQYLWRGCFFFSFFLFFSSLFLSC